MSDLSNIVKTLKDWGLGREERRILLEDPYFDANVFQQQKKFYEDSEKAVYNSLEITNLNGELVVIPTKDVSLNLEEYIQFTKVVPEDLMFGSNGKILDFGSYTSTSFKFSPTKIGLAALAFGIGVTGYFGIIGNAVGDTTDDDTNLEFYWGAASGSVHHYNVYLSINGSNFEFVGTTSTSIAPTITNPYVVPISAEDGKNYRLMAEAEDAEGMIGPMSEQSDIVFCKLRSPGDKSGRTPGDLDGNKVVNLLDWTPFSRAYGSKRGDVKFDYRADFDYNENVNLVDFLTFMDNLGNVYIIPAPNAEYVTVFDNVPTLKLIGQQVANVGEKIFFDVNIEGAKDLLAIAFKVKYDPTILNAEQITPGTFFSNTPPSWFPGKINQDYGTISSTLAEVSSMPKTQSSDGLVARIEFTTKSIGNSNVELKEIQAIDVNKTVVDIQTNYASLTIGALKKLLLQNYPNPSNPETWIPYTLAEECNPFIVIYNLFGQKVRQLELGHKNPGDYTTKDKAAYWDGRNELGEKVASGVYIYKIQANDFIQTRKMILIR